MIGRLNKSCLPIIWPQPPHLLSLPSELISRALLPVPAISTIPPVWNNSHKPAFLDHFGGKKAEDFAENPLPRISMFTSSRCWSDFGRISQHIRGFQIDYECGLYLIVTSSMHVNLLSPHVLRQTELHVVPPALRVPEKQLPMFLLFRYKNSGVQPN
jgi:hypothetical protein